MTVLILDCAGHTELIERVQRTGAHIHLMPDGDVAAAVAAPTPGSGIDMLAGTTHSLVVQLPGQTKRCTVTKHCFDENPNR